MCDRARNRSYAGSWLEHLLRLVHRQELVVFWWQTSHVGSPLNECADMRAEAAKRLDVVPVSRGPITFAKLQWTGAQRGVHHWARVNAQRATVVWLASSCEETPLRNESDIPLSPLPPDLEALSDAVLSARVFAGDPRVRRELGWRCGDEAGGGVPIWLRR